MIIFESTRMGDKKLIPANDFWKMTNFESQNSFFENFSFVLIIRKPSCSISKIWIVLNHMET